MSMRSWIRSLFTRPATRPIRKATRRARPSLEALEDRLVPAGFTVNSIGDTGAGSGLLGDLRYCIAQANSTAGDDTITFDSNVFATPQTITLGGTQLELTDTTGQTTITGPGANLLSISGNNLSRVLQVDSLVKASISDLTITKGNAGGSGNGGYGGGVYGCAGSKTTLTNSTVSFNHAIYGGGVDNYGTLELNGCNLSNNTADHGGALENDHGTATLTNCNVSGNTSTWNGGGLYLHRGAQTTLTNCTVSGNKSLGGTRTGGTFEYSRGGGVYNRHSSLTLETCTVSGNSAVGLGGGLFDYDGQTTLKSCTVRNNSAERGAGLFAVQTTIQLVNCTVSGNTTTGGKGGGVYLASYLTAGNATLTNCTISGNSASKGGGLWVGGTWTSVLASATLINCTVSGNRATSGDGGGIGLGSTGRVILGNTIVAGNTAAWSGPDVYGAVTSLGNNLIGISDDSSGWVSSTDLKGTRNKPLNPKLGPLANNGGPTMTMALLPGSPAINKGNNSLIPSGITTDQRGTGHLRIVNGKVDIGAYESA